MFSDRLNVVAPVFGIALIGWVFAGLRRLDLSSLTDLVLYLTAPALVFSSLVEKSPSAEKLWTIGGGVIFECLASLLAAIVVLGAFGKGGRGLYLAAMIPNTGNLGLPLALFAFGKEGLAIAVIVFVAICLLHYSLGLIVVSGSFRPGHMLRSPLFLAAVLGLLAATYEYSPPLPVMRLLHELGAATVPLMLLSLGVRMRSVRLSRPGRAFAVVLLRMLPGFGAGLLWCYLFSLTGPERGVVVLTGVLPPAVMNFVLAEAYDEQSDEVATAILLGTLLSLASIPLALAFLRA